MSLYLELQKYTTRRDAEEETDCDQFFFDQKVRITLLARRDSWDYYYHSILQRMNNFPMRDEVFSVLLWNL